jgi:RimJ/RimL family protein N-acetyltransferase
MAMTANPGTEHFADIRSRYFPMKNESSGLIAEACSDAEAFHAETAPIYRRVFAHEPVFAVPPERRAAVDHLREIHEMAHHERFLIRDDQGSVVGWMCGEMEDRSTFYLRSTGFLPEHRHRGAARFYPPFLRYLGELGYERITSHHHPHNAPAIIMQLKMGFVIDGMTFDERQGPMVKLVLHVHEDRKQEYLRRFRLA